MRYGETVTQVPSSTKRDPAVRAAERRVHIHQPSRTDTTEIAGQHCSNRAEARENEGLCMLLLALVAAT